MSDGSNIETKGGLNKNEKMYGPKKAKEDQDDAIVLYRLARTVLRRHSFVSDIEFCYKKPYKERKQKKYIAILNELQRIACLTKSPFSINENLTALVVTC